jgi:MFS superfamily sulfate permease-like transporter
MFKEMKRDLPASIVVFFVALPLCLGIALASGAPLFAGIISGIVGGIIVGSLSGSPLGVSGPAAGLAVIVFDSIVSLGSYQAFLLAVVIAGCIQLMMGYAKAGIIAYFFPSSVIKGMLTGIGLLIILKQIPHALGYDKNYEGSLSFIEMDGENTFSALAYALSSLSAGAVVISLISIVLLVLWEVVLSKKHKVFKILPGPVAVIFFGILMNYLYQSGVFSLSLTPEQVVSIPVAGNISEFLAQFTFPTFSGIRNFEVWKTGIVIAVVASLETLLCVEATDKLDPIKRVTPTNRELKAQGMGNIISGLIGGLPVTQVIVRSSANITFGARTKLSGILHGFFLLVSAVTITSVLNMIPLSSLAAILIIVGYKLAKPKIFKEMFGLGLEQFIPFFTTVVGILLTDLLMGITVGMVFGIFFTLYHSYKNSHSIKKTITNDKEVEVHHLVLAQDVSFFNKASILKTLNTIPENSKVIIDTTFTKSISIDVLEIIANFEMNAESKNITLNKIRTSKENL